MKAKLIKKIFSGGEYEYTLHLDGEVGVYAKSGVGHGWLKLSKQNCDSLFGVVDVEKLAFEHSNDLGGRCSNRAYKSFKDGFNKALSLNKDKVFTEDDLRKAIRFGFNGAYGYLTGEKGTIEKQSDNYIQSLQQPTEIEVEIEVEEKPNMDYKTSFGGGQDSHYNPMFIKETKLDTEGQLILKKI